MKVSGKWESGLDISNEHAATLRESIQLPCGFGTLWFMSKLVQFEVLKGLKKVVTHSYNELLEACAVFTRKLAHCDTKHYEM